MQLPLKGVIAKGNITESYLYQLCFNTTTMTTDIKEKNEDQKCNSRLEMTQSSQG